MSTSTNGYSGWTTPTMILGLPPGAVDMTATRVISLNGTWHLYIQAVTTCCTNAAIYDAFGASLTSLTWSSAPIVTINPPPGGHDNPTGVGTGEAHQWFNATNYGGYPGYGVMGVYNDFNYDNEGQYEFAALSANGTQGQYWYGPTYPAVSQTGSNYTIMYPDVILSGSLDALTQGDFGLAFGDGCYSGQEAYRPVVGLGFLNSPYIYKYGSSCPNQGYCSTSPIAVKYSAPSYSQAVIETSGVNNSGFRPRIARNQYGYIDPVPGSNPREWTTYVYYTSNQVGQNSDTGCDYSNYNKVNATIGVTQITITEQ